MIKEFFEWLGYVEKQKDTSIASAKTCSEPDIQCMYSEFADWKQYITDYIYKHISDKKKYEEYDLMDNETAEISTALDIITDYIVYGTNSTDMQPFKIKLSTQKYQNMIDNIINRIEFYKNIPAIIRSALKYGDNWEEILRNKSNTMVVGTRYIPIESVLPNIENGILQTKPMIKQISVSGKELASLNDDEIFRISIYKNRKRMVENGKGTSVIEKCRLIYRQIRLMEEGLMITRLSRCNQNYAMMVDVGELQGDDALDFLDKYKKRLMRRKYIDKSTGKMTWEYNPLSVSEDILLPTRQGSGSGITVLNNSSDVGQKILDIEYFQNKLIYATGVPKLLIGKETDINSKSTSDVQLAVFYRSVRRYQTIIAPFIADFMLKCANIEKVDIKPSDIQIEWAILDSIDEKRRYEIEKLKLEIASTLTTDLSLVDDFYVYTKILGWTDEEAYEMMARLDAEEEAYATEVDDILAQADDLTGVDTDEFDSVDQAHDKKQKQKIKKVLEPEDENGTTDTPTEEELQNYVRTKLGEEKYNEWLKIQSIIDKHPEIQETLAKVIIYTQAQLGE